jgi:glyoxylase-like metal-dependent hydrolase (beta-lactamase superfamily II)
MTDRPAAPVLPGIETLVCRRDHDRGTVKAYLLHDEDSTVLVDTGFSPADGDLIADAIAEHRSLSAGFSAIVLTHAHSDHVGGLATVRSRFSWPVAAHRAEDAALRAVGVHPDILVEDGERWSACGGLTFVHLPGHTAGSLAIHHERTRALLVGDAIVSAARHLIVSPPFMSDDPVAARESAERLVSLGLDVDAVLVAHGEDVPRHAREPLRRMLLAVKQPR